LSAVDGHGGYLLGNQRAEAGQRFDAMAQLFDPVTFRHLDAIGLGPGWRCWEVGAGGASVPAAIAERVGAAGYVLATDIDTSWLTVGPATFDVERHDVAADPPPQGPFDLVHARLVLVHVPRRQAALATLVGALRPGGWLLIEDADPALQPLGCPDDIGPAQHLANRIRQGFRELLAGRDADLSFGRTLPRLLRDAGLHDVEADVYFPLASPACNALEIATVGHLRSALVRAGVASEAEIDQHLAAVTAGGLDLATAPLVSAWGRRPA
jgi:SAM-dependent methyltransferase